MYYCGWRGFSYVYQLILREKERLFQQKRVESLLLEGLERGESIDDLTAWLENCG